ncbi:hypothetical protein LTR85_000392 [Meristemomyces frigidus]|nr:hypothetical protein LTR85_000392 [Meristemomyces frigidus]
MRHGRNCQSSDPRDKVYAFLGLADPSYAVAVDYSTASTVNAVLTGVAAAIVRVEKRLDILAIAMDDKGIYPTRDHLLTWVPNWSRPENPNSEYKQFLRGIQFPMKDKVCRASKDRDPIFSFHADRNGNPNRILKIAAIYVDTLGRIVEDSNLRPWRRFASGSDLVISTVSVARPGDEVWVLLGADEPFVLTKPSARDDVYIILGHAMLWEPETKSEDRQRGIKPSPILDGALVDALDRGELSTRMISIG